jgi:hypothetical protein
MTALPAVHLVVMQPQGYVHSLGFLDQARYLRHQFRRFGAEVSLAKNRLREDAVNFVFGAHLGFAPEWKQRHACVFFNLEQLGQGGAKLSPDYLKLLSSSAVVDYDAANVSSYAVDAADVPIVPFLHAPYLEDAEALPLESRPIDLLFFGSMNPRRQAYLQRIESCGVKVTGLAHALYGPERDRLVRQAKAVINCHFYESSRFEQARAFHCLSLGTPVISERGPSTQVPEAFEDAVQWLRSDEDLVRYFTDEFRRPEGMEAARARLETWRQHDPMEAYADLLAFAAGYLRGWRQAHDTSAPWRPRQVQLMAGTDHRPGCLHLDLTARSEPDLIADLGAEPLVLPLDLETRFGSPLRLEAGSMERITRTIAKRWLATRSPCCRTGASSNWSFAAHPAWSMRSGVLMPTALRSSGGSNTASNSPVRFPSMPVANPVPPRLRPRCRSCCASARPRCRSACRLARCRPTSVACRTI